MIKKISNLRKKGISRVLSYSLTKIGVPEKLGFGLLKNLWIATSPYKYATRKEKILRLLKDYPPAITIPKDMAYRFVKQGELPGLKEVFKHCSDLFEKKKHLVKQFYSKNNSYKVELLSLGKNLESKEYYDLDEVKPIVEFATRPDIVSIAADFLGEKPIIGNILLFHSNVNDKTVGAQKYHLDRILHKRLQFFVAITDIDDDSGPFTFIPGDKSAELVKRINYQDEHLPDSEVYKHISQKEAIKFIGPKGSTIAINGSQCFHYGSRCRKKPRVLLEILYSSRFNPQGEGEVQLYRKLRKEDIEKIDDPCRVIR